MLADVERFSVSPVFVGRAAEMAELDAALERAALGRPQALLIGGEAGVGKTRVLEEFGARAARQGALPAFGGCVEIGAEGLPYAPIVTALRGLHRALGPDSPELAAAIDGSQGQLARILPEWGEAAADSPDEYGRARLFEHIARLFERLSAERTVVLAVEDLHWSDRSTRELLLYLIRSVRPGSRLVILGTYRTDDLHRRHPLRPFLAELERLRTVQRLELTRFGRSEVAEQLAGILAAAPEDALVSRIHRRSEGNPFFVEELAVSHQQGCRGLSESLRDLLLVRVEKLPEQTQRILRVLASGGSSVEHALLAAVLDDLTPDQLLTALRCAVEENIVRATADGEGYRFRHALVREAVDDDLLPGESTAFCLRYAEVLAAHPELVPADQRAARLARYWHCAGVAERALPAALDAARAARCRNAFAEQLQMLDRALELWPRVPEEALGGLRAHDYAETYPACTCTDPAHDHGRLYYLDVLAEAVVAARLCGEREHGFALTKRALEIIDEAQDPLRAAWFWGQRARLLGALGRGDGREQLDHARALAETRPPSAVLAELLSRLGACDMVDWPGPEGLRTAERAVAIAREAGTQLVELHSRCIRASIKIMLGEGEEGLPELRAVLAEARAHGDPDLVSRAYVNLSDALEGLGRSEEAAEVAAAGVDWVRGNGLRVIQGALLIGNQVEPLIALGRLAEAEAHLAEVGPGEGSSKEVRFLHRLRAELALRRGDHATAEALLEAALEDTPAPAPAQSLLPIQHARIRLAGRQGRYAEARALVTELLDTRPAILRYARYSRPLLTEAVALEADARGLPALDADRPRVLERIAAVAAGLPADWPAARGWAALFDAELARARGESGSERSLPELFREAARLLEPVGHPVPTATALLRAAEAEAARGERAEAGRLLLRAAHWARRSGDVRLVRETELLAERARLPLAEPRGSEGAARSRAPEQRGPGEVDAVAALGLTRRERDVLRLLTEGCTNRQIAERLFISLKTASVHVSNILAKLEVATRGEAASVAHRLRLFPEPASEPGPEPASVQASVPASAPVPAAAG